MGGVERSVGRTAPDLVRSLVSLSLQDPSEIRDVLVSTVQTLGERAEDVRGRMTKDPAQPLIGADRSALAAVSKDRRMKAAGVLLVLSFVVLLRRRRKQRRRQRSES